MIRPPPRSTRTDTLFPYTTLFRSPLIFASIASAAIASSSHFLAGQRRGLLHPVGERGFVDLVVLMDMEIARIAAFRRDRRHRIERLRAQTRSEERREGKEGVSTGRFRGTPIH